MFRTGNQQNDVEQGPGGERSYLPFSVCADCCAIKDSEGQKELHGQVCRPSHSSKTDIPILVRILYSLVQGINDLTVCAEAMDNRNDPSRSPGEELHEQHQNSDFDDSANDLWSLYGKKAKSHDQARIKTLKDDMNGILIFVCACLFWSTNVDVVLHSLGWLILCCSHSFRRTTDSESASKPRGPVCLLPESIRPDARSNIATTRIRGQPDFSKFHSPIPLPDFSSICN